MQKQHIDVFISSTSIDLPEHRQAVINALLSIGLFPSGMEHWPVADENPVDLCRQKIDEAEIYVGIYAHRYGWRPGGEGTPSITTMEYDWATERKIPRFCFIIDKKYPWSPEDMELDAKADLDAFKARVSQQVRGTFTTPDNLAKQVLAALAPFAQKQDMSAVTPYLRQLHHEAMQSGLLRTLDPRTKDPAFQGRHVTVDQVYTPLDTHDSVLRDENRAIQWEPLTVRGLEEMRERDNLTPLSAMEAASHYPSLVVLGDPGSGKSTFVNFLALGLTGHRLDPKGGWLDRLRAQGWEQGDLLPVYVTLRDFAQDMGEQPGTAQSLLEHLTRLMVRCGCPDAMTAVRHALSAGGALLILDGLDEVPAEKREAVRDTVKTFMQAYDRCRVLITCRILSYANPEGQIPAADTVTLAPFDEDKIKHFIQAWYIASTSTGSTDPATAQARTDDLTGAIQDERLRDMAANPMLLTVMAMVHNHRGALPRETARLYYECVDLLMLHWRPRDAQALKDRLSVQDNDLYQALWKLAYDAHDRQNEQDRTADLSEADVVFSLREKLGGLDNAALFCDYVEQRAGLLYSRGLDSSGIRIYTFPHRTFQEYLAGCFIASSSRAFNRVVSEKARLGEKWRQVLLMATGQMVFIQNDTERPIDAVDHLLRPDPEDDAGWRSVWLAGDMLLLIGLQRVILDDIGKNVLPLARQRLAALVSGGHLEPVERAAAGRTLAELGDPRPGVGLRSDGLPDIDWVEIPAGEFIYQKGEQLTLPTFYISRYPVTYAQFQAFIDAPDGFHNSQWWEGLAADDDHKNAPGEQAFKFSNHPRERVSWYEAVAFCRWLTAKLPPVLASPPGPLSQKTGEGEKSGDSSPSPFFMERGWGEAHWEIRLPTEQEWEKVARGTDRREYPWGNGYRSGYANINETWDEAGPYYLQTTTAVGLYPQGASPYGVLDMAGNVWEWCLNEYNNTENPGLAGAADRVVRGGSWGNDQVDGRAVYRFRLNPTPRHDLVGFRLVCVPHL